MNNTFRMVISLVVETDNETIEESIERIFAKLAELGYLDAEEIPDEDASQVFDRLITPGYH